MNVKALIEPIRKLHARIRGRVISTCEGTPAGELARVVEETQGDTIFVVDRISEGLLVELFERDVAPSNPLVLIAEGIEGGRLVLPRRCSEADALWRVIVDPIDGTRGLMYQKRSGWILTGVARNRGPGTNLQDIELAVQTEIPLVKQHLCDTLWAVRGEGVCAERVNRLSGESQPLHPRPSGAGTIRQGFATLARFFGGAARDELASIDEELVYRILGPVLPGKVHCFEDQYISTGGQLYELLAGHDRFVADLRPLMEQTLARRGLAIGLCCHPYDVCTELIARELGVLVTDVNGGR
jgi:hypothetical protein